MRKIKGYKVYLTHKTTDERLYYAHVADPKFFERELVIRWLWLDRAFGHNTIPSHWADMIREDDFDVAFVPDEPE